MARPHKCPYCGQNASISKGIRRTKTLGDRCIRLCTNCRRKFTPKHQPGPERTDAAQPETPIVAESPSPTDETPQSAEAEPPLFQSASELLSPEPGNDRPA